MMAVEPTREPIDKLSLFVGNLIDPEQFGDEEYRWTATCPVCRRKGALTVDGSNGGLSVSCSDGCSPAVILATDGVMADEEPFPEPVPIETPPPAGPVTPEPKAAEAAQGLQAPAIDPTPRSSAAQFFDVLFAECEYNVNVRAISDKPAISEFVRGADEILKFAERYKDRNIYFGCATVQGGAKKENIKEIPVLWCDVDFKNTPKEEAKRLISEFPLPPTFSVASGGGRHIYWLLKESAGQEEVKRVEAILRGLAKVLKGDSGATDASRILRVPGSLNHKYDPPREVRVVKANTDRRYNLSDLAIYAEAIPDKPLAAPPLPDRIREGEGRNNALFSLAGTLQRRGVAPAAIEAALLAENQAKCDPPLPEKEVRGIIANVGKYPPAPMVDVAKVTPALQSKPPKRVAALPDERHKDFPGVVMTGAAGDFAHLFHSYTEPAKQFYFMSYLTCLGNILSGTVTLDSELAPQPRLYTLLLGASGDDRKSHSITQTVKWFRESYLGFNSCEGVGSAEGLLKRLAKDGRMILWFDEFMAFVGKCKIDSSVLLPCTNSLYENNWYESQTKKEEIRLSNVHLSLLAASTVDTYEKTWSSLFTGIGFNNRLWLVTGAGKRKFSCPPTIPRESKFLAKKKLEAVLDHAGKYPVLKWEQEASDIYQEWYMARKRSIHSKRLDTYALRFMILLSVNDLKGTVDVDTVRKVIALCEHQHYLRQLHDPIDADNTTAALEEKIRRVLKAKGTATVRELKRALHVKKTGLWFYGMAIKNLSEDEMGYDKDEKKYFLQPEGIDHAGEEGE